VVKSLSNLCEALDLIPSTGGKQTNKKKQWLLSLFLALGTYGFWLLKKQFDGI
jgi:hypothetical protein